MMKLCVCMGVLCMYMYAAMYVRTMYILHVCTCLLSAVEGSLLAVWVFAERACSWADSWGTAGAAQKW